jgi:serine/threonine protein kinase
MEKLLHYDIAEKLGEGKHGEVYQALDSGLSRVVAIKVFRPPLLVGKERDQFLEDMVRLIEFDDEVICRYYGLEDIDGAQYLIREYVDGTTVRELAARQPFPFESVLALACDVVQSLQRAHNRGVLHLNITSTNLFVTNRGKARLVDFDLPFGEPGFDFKLADPRDLTYLAPEQIQGHRVDRQTDFYGLGVVIYEMLTGRLPFAVDDTATTMERILHEPPELERRQLVSLPNEARLLLKRLLAKNPSDRFASVNGLLTTLEEMEVFESRDPRKRHRPYRGDSARGYFWIAIVMAALLIFWIVVTAVRH